MKLTPILQNIPIEAIANGISFTTSYDHQWIALKIEHLDNAEVLIYPLEANRPAFNFSSKEPIRNLQFCPETGALIILQATKIVYWHFLEDTKTQYDIQSFADETFLDYVYDPDEKIIYLLQEGWLSSIPLPSAMGNGYLSNERVDTKLFKRLLRTKDWITPIPGRDFPRQEYFAHNPTIYNKWGYDDTINSDKFAGMTSVGLSQEEYYFAWVRNVEGANTEIIISRLLEYPPKEISIHLEGVNAFDSKLIFLQQDQVLLLYAAHSFYFYDVASGALLEKINYQTQIGHEKDWIIDFTISSDQSSLLLAIAIGEDQKDPYQYTYDLAYQKINIPLLRPKKQAII